MAGGLDFNISARSCSTTGEALMASATIHFTIRHFKGFDQTANRLDAMSGTGPAPDFDLVIENANPASGFNWNVATGVLTVPPNAELTFTCSSFNRTSDDSIYFPTGMVCLSAPGSYGAQRPFRNFAVNYSDSGGSLQVHNQNNGAGGWGFQILVQQRRAIGGGGGLFNYNFGLIDPRLQTS
jgi:hypothetical protein